MAPNRLWLGLAGLLTLALCGCAVDKDDRRNSSATTTTREVGQRADTEHEVGQRELEFGPTVVETCQGGALDCQQALADKGTVADPGARPPADGGPVRITRRYRLPIGSDPRTAPAPGPAEPSVRVTDHEDRQATSTVSGERDTQRHEVAQVDNHREVHVGPPWWVWIVVPLVLAAGALAYWKMGRVW